MLLAAGNKVSLQLNNGSLAVLFDRPGRGERAGGEQSADSGRWRPGVLERQGADAVSKAVVNNTGIIEARTVENHDGVIRLLGDATVGQVNVGGTLDASRPTAGMAAPSRPRQRRSKSPTRTHHHRSARRQDGHLAGGPDRFTIAASGGDISGATLSSELATTGVTLASYQRQGVGQRAISLSTMP